MTRSTKEPLRAAVARLVTAGDEEFVGLISPHPVYEEPRALVFCLEAQLIAEQCIFCFLSPDATLGPRFAMFAKPFRRFRPLCEDLEQQVQGLLAPSDVGRIESALNAALAREPVWEKRIRGSKICYYSEVVECLMHRIQRAGSEIFKRIRNGEVRAAVVPIDGVSESPAGDMPASAITDEMFIGDDRCIHQSKNSTRKWRVSWIEEVAKTKGKLESPSDNGCDEVPWKRRPGRPPDQRDAVEARMTADINNKHLTPERLRTMKQEALAKQYSACRDTVCKARERVLSEIAGN
jgi:hypothetical protein